MKKNKTLLIGIIVFTAVMIGASVLYGFLTKNMDSSNLSGIGSETTESAAETTAGETGEETLPSGETETTVPEETEPPMAPDFTVTDREGNPVQLSDYFGKPIILNFWASWCGPCQAEMPELQKAYDAFGKEIHFLIVNMTDGGRETKERAEKFIANSGYTFPVLFDTEMEAAAAFRAYSLPTTYFLNEKGQLIARGVGALQYESLLTGIGMIAPDLLPEVTE